MSQASLVAQPSRVLSNFLNFVYNLQYIHDALNAFLEKSRRVVENYEPNASSVPEALKPLNDAMDQIRRALAQALTDIKGQENEFATHGTCADGRGAWRMVLRVILRITHECNSNLSKLPQIPKNESAGAALSRKMAQSSAIPIFKDANENLRVFVTIFPTLIQCTLYPESIADEESTSIVAKWYTHPFWYNVRFSSLSLCAAIETSSPSSCLILHGSHSFICFFHISNVLSTLFYRIYLESSSCNTTFSTSSWFEFLLSVFQSSMLVVS